jgi:hypothetical protein
MTFARRRSEWVAIAVFLRRALLAFAVALAALAIYAATAHAATWE